MIDARETEIGVAGEIQVGGAKTALGIAYGANSQDCSMWVVANSLNPFGCAKRRKPIGGIMRSCSLDRWARLHERFFR